MPAIVDRLLARAVVTRMLIVIGLIVVILSLENVQRLTADLQQTVDPAHLLTRLSLLLIPEHLSAAIPVALLLGVAMTVRTLAINGEWQVFAAAGMSRRRLLLAPLGVALIVGGVQLALRMELRPNGERALDALYGDIRTGAHGIPLPIGEPVAIAPDTTLFVTAVQQRPGRRPVLAEVMVTRGDTVFSAPVADIVRSGNATVAINLLDGTAVTRPPVGKARTVSFRTLRLSGSPDMIGMADHDFRQRLDRSGAADLLTLARTGLPEERAAATAAFAMRIDSALFCLAIPLFGIVLGHPGRRRSSAVGIGVGIVLIVAHMKSAAFVEDHFAADAIAAATMHAAIWFALGLAALRLDRRFGEGFVEQAAAAIVTLCRPNGGRRQPRTLPDAQRILATQPRRAAPIG